PWQWLSRERALPGTCAAARRVSGAHETPLGWFGSGEMGWGAEMSIRNRVLSWLLRGAGIALALLWFVPRESVARVAFQAAPLIPVPNLVGYWCADGAIPDAGTSAKD